MKYCELYYANYSQNNFTNKIQSFINKLYDASFEKYIIDKILYITLYYIIYQILFHVNDELL